MYLCIIHWYYVLFTGTIKNAFSALGTIHDCVLYFQKKKIAADAAKICAPHGSYGGSLSSVSEPNIRLTLKPNRRQKSASVCPNRAPALKTLHSVCTVVKSLFDRKKNSSRTTHLWIQWWFGRKRVLHLLPSSVSSYAQHSWPTIGTICR